MAIPPDSGTFEHWITDRDVLRVLRPKSGSTGDFETWITDRDVIREYQEDEGVSASVSPSASQSPSASISPSVSPSISPSASISPSISPSASPSPSAGGLIAGTVCWGHDTGVTETNIRDFTGIWSGTGANSGAGDAEKTCIDPGEYMEGEVVDTGLENVELLQNVYASGDTIKLRYRHGATEAACLAASWNDYTVPFASAGFVQVRVEYP